MPDEPMTTEEIAQVLGVSLPFAPKPTIWIVQGVHFHVPGSPLSAHATKENADEAAVQLVNDLFNWIALPEDAKPETWEADLQRARQARAGLMGCEVDELGEDDGDVWITELELKS